MIAAGPYGSAGIRSTSLERARSAAREPGSPGPALPTLRHNLSFDLLTPSASHPPDRSCGDGWSLIDSSLGQKCPRYAGVLIGKGDDDEHGRLTREHPAQPRRGRH